MFSEANSTVLKIKWKSNRPAMNTGLILLMKSFLATGKKKVVSPRKKINTSKIRKRKFMVLFL
jgi:hypothetical protein